MQSRRYSTLFLCLIIAMLVSSALASLVVKRCVPGMSYNNGCNDCHCSREGRQLCTMKRCYDYDPVLKENVPRKATEAPTGFWAKLDVVEPPRA